MNYIPHKSNNKNYKKSLIIGLKKQLFTICKFQIILD